MVAAGGGRGRGCFVWVGIPSYARAVTVEELSRELGVDAGDIEVMIAALGERVDDELSAVQAADLLDVLDAKIRLRR